MDKPRKVDGSPCDPWQAFDAADQGQKEKPLGLDKTEKVLGTNYELECRAEGPYYTFTRYYESGRRQRFSIHEKDLPQVLKTQFDTTQKGKANEQIRHMAKVLYAETGGQMAQENSNKPRQKFRSQYLIASVIWNRVGKKSFGNPQSPYMACDSKREFSCVDSTQNKHWKNAGDDSLMNEEQKATWRECLKIAQAMQSRTFKPVNDKVVYFHAATIAKPSNWDNKYFIASLETECGGHKFYSTHRKSLKKI